MISNGNRTEWSPIQSVIIRVITKSDEREARGRFEITSTITPWIVLHSVQLLIIIIIIIAIIIIIIIIIAIIITVIIIIIIIIKKITISSLVIGFKMSYFPLIRLASCYRTVCYWIVCYWTICHRRV